MILEGESKPCFDNGDGRERKMSRHGATVVHIPLVGSYLAGRMEEEDVALDFFPRVVSYRIM